ncbi:unnamed protein product [Mortierella alpina]
MIVTRTPEISGSRYATATQDGLCELHMYDALEPRDSCYGGPLHDNLKDGLCEKCWTYKPEELCKYCAYCFTCCLCDRPKAQ